MCLKIEKGLGPEKIKLKVPQPQIQKITQLEINRGRHLSVELQISYLDSSRSANCAVNIADQVSYFDHIEDKILELIPSNTLCHWKV